MKPHKLLLDPEVHKIMATCGLPYSGKSTFIETYTNMPIVSPDAIRASLGTRFDPRLESHVWAIAETMIFSLFKAGHKTIFFDSTANSIERRKWLIRPKYWSTKFYYCNAPASKCVYRARVAGDDLMIPVIENMGEKFEEPSLDEGMVDLITLDWEHQND